MTTSNRLSARPDQRSEREQLLSGAAAMAALLVGLVPFGLVVGMAAAASAAPLGAWAGTLPIYSGSAHLAVLGTLADGEGLLAVVGTGLLVNARLIALSASLAPSFRGESRRFRLLAAAMLADPLWALVTAQDARRPVRAYYVGAGLVLVVGWSAAVSAGVVLVHTGGLGLAAVGVPLCLLAMVAPYVRVAGGAACVAAGTAVGAATSAWPSGTGVLAAMLAGSLAAAASRRAA
jgi:predicted branched-subunit amino acid permease